MKNILKPFSRAPFFTVQNAATYNISAAQLGYYVKKGAIKRIGRGIYQSTAYKSPVENIRWEDLIDSVNSVPNGVICLISALALHELTEQIPKQHWIAVPHSTSIKRTSDFKIMRFRNMKIGKTTLNLNEIEIPIFDPERTIVDAFRLLSLEIAIKALKMALKKKGKDKLDLRKLQDYAKKLKVNIEPYLITATT